MPVAVLAALSWRPPARRRRHGGHGGGVPLAHCVGGHQRLQAWSCRLRQLGTWRLRQLAWQLCSVGLWAGVDAHLPGHRRVLLGEHALLQMLVTRRTWATARPPAARSSGIRVTGQAAPPGTATCGGGCRVWPRRRAGAWLLSPQAASASNEVQRR